MGCVCLIVLSLLGIFSCRGDALGNQPSPKSPLESLDCIRVPTGFKVEIVATEPLIESPVAFEWGADGKLWVVEMRDYSGGVRTRSGPSVAKALEGGEAGRIVFLEDSKGDGVYDKSTVFLDGLSYPNGICPWRNGVIVSAGGEIFFAYSTNRNGQADVRKTILSGFFQGNPQHRVNGFDYGLDNWLYAANGDSGGRIRSFAGGGVIPIGGCDLRFRPDTGEFDLQAGTSQYGRHRDDWGNWFGNRNVTWLWHYYNLIHREVLEPDGVSFKSHRAAGEQTNEFLSSTDDWFRPVYVKTGPDGALYVALN
jgi:glucose/arabinose dehydrogenase